MAAQFKPSRNRSSYLEPTRGPRLLLYSHDSYGLGHLRRNLTIAEAFVRRAPGASAMLVTGSSCATSFPCPESVEIVKLPSVTKDEAGRYVPRTLGDSLARVLRMRRAILLETLRAFEPDVFVVDHQVIGLHGEAEDALVEAKRRGIRTVLGLRDVIDAPDVVEREWLRPAVSGALRTLYDKVCVYGSSEIYDGYRGRLLPSELCARVEFCGYVTRGQRAARAGALPSVRSNVLVTMGGGEDGEERVETYFESVRGDVPWNSTIVLGPLLDERVARRFKRAARLLPGVECHRFHADLPGLMGAADAIVAMAGYNTCTEILNSRKPAIFVPRTSPRREQLIRAERLEALGVGRCLVAPTPSELLSTVADMLQRGVTSRDFTSALQGADRVAEVLTDLVHGNGEQTDAKAAVAGGPE